MVSSVRWGLPKNHTFDPSTAPAAISNHRTDTTPGAITHHRIDLDSHANMVVMGINSFVFETTGKSCNVRPFLSELGMAHDVPIVDAAVAFDCPYRHKTYIKIRTVFLFPPQTSIFI